MRRLTLFLIAFAVSTAAFAEDRTQRMKEQEQKKSATVALVRAGLLMDWQDFNMLIKGGDIARGFDADDPLATHVPQDSAFAVAYTFNWRF